MDGFISSKDKIIDANIALGRQDTYIDRGIKFMEL